MDEQLQVQTLANLIEIGKRVLLNIKTDSIQIPYKEACWVGEPVDLNVKVSEDMAAALSVSIREKAALEGVIVNAK